MNNEIQSESFLKRVLVKKIGRAWAILFIFSVYCLIPFAFYALSIAVVLSLFFIGYSFVVVVKETKAFPLTKRVGTIFAYGFLLPIALSLIVCTFLVVLVA